MGLLLFVLMALVAGLLAGAVMGRRLGLLSALGVGVLGALLGGFMFRLVRVYVEIDPLDGVPPYVDSLVLGFLGAVLVLALLRAMEGER